MEWVQCKDVAAAERAAAEFIAARLAAAARDRGWATLAISGGRSPWGMLAQLAAQELPWNDVHVFQVDERIVPPEHEARNWKRFLASPLAGRVPDANRHAMPVEVDESLTGGRPIREHADRRGPAIRRCSTSCTSGWVRTVIRRRCLPAIRCWRRRHDWVGASGMHQGHRRLSLTLPALESARCIVWFAVGATRRDAVRRLLAGDPAIPASRVERDRAIGFTDPEAAPAM